MQHGLRVVGANVEVAGGEIDLLAVDGGTTVAVEVRTTTGSADPLDAADEPKRRRVRRLAAAVGADRVDFVGLRVDAGGVDVHWLPGPS